MKKLYTLLFAATSFVLGAGAQSLGRSGSPTDTVTPCSTGTVLMGGGTDVDAAFKWMIQKSAGGDFVIIRAAGTNAYNSYVYGLGNAHSVETFLVAGSAQANDSAIVRAVRKAEAVFFACGNQNDYISYRGSALGAALDYLANVKHAPIGGTSAGMAIQGYVYYDGITNVLSPDVLANPYLSGTGIHYNDFLHNPFLQKTLCETHFNTKGGTTSNNITGRQGRLMSFLARMIQDEGMSGAKAVACDEATAVCIDANGLGMVVGQGKAYFLRQWCAAPETCSTGKPLHFTNGAKVFVLAAPGNLTTMPASAKSFPLATWTGGTGGVYEYWTVAGGVLTIGQPTGTPPVCNPTGIDTAPGITLPTLSPNPATDIVSLRIPAPVRNARITVTDMSGKRLLEKWEQWGDVLTMDVSALPAGTYFIFLSGPGIRYCATLTRR